MSEQRGRRVGEHGSSPVGMAAALNKGQATGKSQTEKYQVRGRDRLHVNREASKKVQQSRACKTRLLQLGFTDSNCRKRTYETKQRQPRSVSPLPIPRNRKQSHAGKVNCSPRSKTASQSLTWRAKPGYTSCAAHQTLSSSQLHKAPKYKLNCENEELLHQCRPNIMNFASPGRENGEEKLQGLKRFPFNVLFTAKRSREARCSGRRSRCPPRETTPAQPVLRRRRALLRSHRGT